MASRFWVGGTGTWDGSDTTHWSTTTGGAGGQSPPGSGDTVTLDGASGGGTVTVNTTVNITSLTFGAFTGTLDFSANNNNVTANTVSGTGTGTRTLNMGNGTWTITNTGNTNVWDYTTTTGLTHNKNSSSLIFSAAAIANRAFVTGGQSFNNVTIADTGSAIATFTFSATNCTFTNFTITAPCRVSLGVAQTLTVTNVPTFIGTSSNPILLASSSALNTNRPTISVASGTSAFDWCFFQGIAFTGGATFSNTNSIGMGNTGITLSPPSGGGGSSGHFIGG